MTEVTETRALMVQELAHSRVLPGVGLITHKRQRNTDLNQHRHPQDIGKVLLPSNQAVLKHTQ